jgi:hypothetical protein
MSVVVAFMMIMLMQVSAVANQAPAPAKPVIKPAVPSPATGRWAVKSQRSEMSGKLTVVASLQADAPVRGRFSSSTPTLVLRCREGELEAYINFGIIVDDDYANRLRWDEREAIEEYNWSESSDYEALFTSEPVEFITAATSARRLRFEFHPHGLGPQIARFIVGGLNSIVQRLDRACPEAGLAQALSSRPGLKIGEQGSVPAPVDSDPVVVMIVGGAIYHRKDCITVSGHQRIEMKVSEVPAGASPCAECKPPTPKPQRIQF